MGIGISRLFEAGPSSAYYHSLCLCVPLQAYDIVLGEEHPVACGPLAILSEFAAARLERSVLFRVGRSVGNICVRAVDIRSRARWLCQNSPRLHVRFHHIGSNPLCDRTSPDVPDLCISDKGRSFVGRRHSRHHRWSDWGYASRVQNSSGYRVV